MRNKLKKHDPFDETEVIINMQYCELVDKTEKFGICKFRLPIAGSDGVSDIVILM